jgi:glucose/arabinose dehydrogenase
MMYWTVHIFVLTSLLTHFSLLINAAVKVPEGFQISIIANIPGARQLVTLPNGDLIVGTHGTTVKIISNADAPDAVGPVTTFATFPEDYGAQGVALGNGFIYAATQKTIWRMPYKDGQKTGTPVNISSVRTGPIAPHSDGDVHRSTSVIVSDQTLYAGVGSSCNSCEEVDPTRATIQMMALDGSNMKLKAHRWRNVIALAVDPKTKAVWAGGAGQDSLPAGHPFEFMDPVSLRSTPADYGWPVCEENRVPYSPGANCSQVVVPALEFPAYSTIIAATFYPLETTGLPYGFPKTWLGGLFVSMHGSWHHNASNVPWDPPLVAFVPFDSETRMPKSPVNWNNPYSQWSEFVTGFQDAQGNRIGRCSGLAIGSNGSLFLADDGMGNIYRIRPTKATF